MLSSLSSSLDTLSPLTSRPARSSPPGCLNLCKPTDRCYKQMRVNQRKIVILMTLLTSTTSSLTSPQLYQQTSIHRKLFSLFSSLLIFLSHCWWLCNLQDKNKKLHREPTKPSYLPRWLTGLAHPQWLTKLMASLNVELHRRPGM